MSIGKLFPWYSLGMILRAVSENHRERWVVVLLDDDRIEKKWDFVHKITRYSITLASPLQHRNKCQTDRQKAYHSPNTSHPFEWGWTTKLISKQHWRNAKGRVPATELIDGHKVQDCSNVHWHEGDRFANKRAICLHTCNHVRWEKIQQHPSAVSIFP